MLKTKTSSAHKDGVKVRGFFRVQITEDGKGVMGDQVLLLPRKPLSLLRRLRQLTHSLQPRLTFQTLGCLTHI